ncbi:hypothetical protein, partial [Epilithonimonas sp.]|uniref:hypothetical protein n=1 Tax=Epilithonimonas sp. TaxID=2894511 RepID=UPI002896E8A5
LKVKEYKNRVLTKLATPDTICLEKLKSFVADTIIGGNENISSVCFQIRKIFDVFSHNINSILVRGH